MTITKTHDGITPSIDKIINAFSAANQKKILWDLGKEFLRQTLTNFGGNGSTYKEKTWPPLSKSYAKKVGRSNATEVLTGKLRDSFKMRYQGKGVVIYTNNPYAAAQAFGNPKTKLPARNYFPIENIGNPHYSRLLFNSDKEIFNLLSKQLNALSYGELPYQASPQQRMLPEYGNPFNFS